MQVLRDTLEAMRIQQWIKNTFVLAAPFFGRALTTQPIEAAGAFAAFCLASSAVYLANDVVDLERDRAHPVKRNRPIASGRVSVPYALVLAALLIVASLAIAALVASPLTAAVTGLYLIANVLYSLVLKHLVILDVMFIAAAFILRILAGAVATKVEPSYWLVLCTLNVALFLGFAKRRAELDTLEEEAVNHRKVLDQYSPLFLDQMIAVVTGTTLVCYILYTVDARTVHTFGTRGLLATVPFVIYGIFRYLYLTYRKDRGGSPTKAILTDVAFLVNLTCWGVLCIVVIYWGRQAFAWLPW